MTISCGEHNFPAHKLILSVCSPYFKSLFIRSPCQHPIVIVKDVHFKYMKLLLIYMYRGEVAVPQEDLAGLLKTARSLQVRGLSEMHSPTPAQISPRKRYLSEMMPDSDLESQEEESYLDKVKTRLCGQLEIQAVRGDRGSPSSGGTPPLTSSWLSERVKYLPATSSHTDDLSAGIRSSRSESGPSEDEPHSQVRGEFFSFSLNFVKKFQICNKYFILQFKREAGDWSASDNGSDDTRDPRDMTRKHLDKKPAVIMEPSNPDTQAVEIKKEREAKIPKLDHRKPAIPNNSSLIDAARAMGLDIPQTPAASTDSMSSISALLAAAQATGGLPPSCTPSSDSTKPQVTSVSSGAAPGGGSTAPPAPGSSQGLDLSNPMANVNVRIINLLISLNLILNSRLKCKCTCTCNL